MTNRDIYDAALALLAEEQDELSDDYAQRAPFIFSTFFGECRVLDGMHKSALRQAACEPYEGGPHPDLDDEFPLSDSFFSPAVFYVASMLVEMENTELSDRFFSRYADAISRIAQFGVPAKSTKILDVYGFHRCD